MVHAWSGEYGPPRRELPARTTTGRLRQLISKAHEYGCFWSTTGAVCVGQADLAENVTNASGLDERVRIRDGGSSGPQLAEYKSGGKISGNAIVFTTDVKRVFDYSVITVCVAVIHQSDGSVVPNTTVCHSL